ncbi:FAD dependent oxidoreductase superfamily protein [Rutstroemia sp. NJR-2017a WRK4]|nr:FAD dependent oxidoreductase superfamily protein [Rutstroemia sp. NJR-2017a WRK4]
MSKSPEPPLRLPVTNSTDPFWHKEKHPIHNHGSDEESPIPEFSDVVIIGAGYAGVATAYNIVKGNPTGQKLSVTILEARSVCSGATGRNGGHLRPDLYGHIPKYIDRYNAATGEELAKFEVEHVQALKELIERENIECDFVMTRTCDVWTTQQQVDQFKAVYEGMKSHGFKYMDDVEFTEGEEAEAVSGVKGAMACTTYSAATLSPYKLITQLLATIVNTGSVNLRTNAPVVCLIPYSSGGYLVETRRGDIRAGKVIHATNAYISDLLPEYSASVVPCKGICCHISLPEGSEPPPVKYSYIIRNKESVLDYLIPRADGSIIVGGASKNFRPYEDQWYNNVNDDTLIKAVDGYYDDYMQRTFKGWEDSGAKVKTIWTGIMGYSADSNPHVGSVPNRKDQFVIAGFNGHGMPVIWLAAKGLAEMICEGKNFEEVETKMPKLLKTTEERLMKAQNGPVGGDILSN